MENMIIFLVEMVLCLAISVVLVKILKSHLHNILEEICGSGTRADFWVVFTQLMIFISPLLIVTYFTETVDPAHLNPVAILQNTIFRILLGNFVALIIIGFVIRSSIPLMTQKIAQAVEDPKS